ncbi:MAG: hypothetical protein M1839_006752 [Geoglossum umbratile]|nr:MAG: hypothetical protein M1839_006752 [Geoglossum umbratile]
MESIFSFGMTFSVTRLSLSMDQQLYQSPAYQRAYAVEMEDLWSRNHELLQESYTLLKKIEKLEEVEQLKTERIASLLREVGTLQKSLKAETTQTNELILQLQVAKIETARRFKVYQEDFNQSRLEFLKAFQRERDEIANLKAKLRDVRESHAQSVLLHTQKGIMNLDAAWKKLKVIAPLPLCGPPDTGESTHHVGVPNMLPLPDPST